MPSYGMNNSIRFDSMRTFGLITVICLASVYCRAQKIWTLEDCIHHALQYNVEIRQQQVVVDKQVIQVETAKYSRLPNLMLDATEKFDFGRTLNRENTYDDLNSQNSSFSLSSEVSLFSGYRTTATIAREKIELRIQAFNQDQISKEISLQVVRSYYQVLLDREIVSIAEEQIKLGNELIDLTRELVGHGKVPESQLLDVEAQVANDELTLTKARHSLRLSLLELSQLLELPSPEPFDIAGVEEEPYNLQHQDPHRIYQIAATLMPEVKSAGLAVERAGQAIRIARSDYYPSLAMGAGITSGYYHYSNINNANFNEQFRNNLQQSIYLTLRIPLFNRLATRNSVRIARKEQEESSLALLNTQKQLYKEIQKAWYDALSAQEKYYSTQKAVRANAEALRYAFEKYHAGRFTVYEYNEIKLKLANSQSEQAQSKYESMLQKKLLDYYEKGTITNNL